VVSITATDPWASESSGDTGTFTVSRTGDLTNSLTVSYIVGGDAVSGTDYAALSGSVVIPAGSSSAPITVTPLQDGPSEDVEGVNVGLVSGNDYTVGNASTDTIDILSAPATPQVTLDSNNFGVMETDGVATVTVDLKYATPGQTVTVFD
jgi:Calx-beta domain